MALAQHIPHAARLWWPSLSYTDSFLPLFRLSHWTPGCRDRPALLTVLGSDTTHWAATMSPAWVSSLPHFDSNGGPPPASIAFPCANTSSLPRSLLFHVRSCSHPTCQKACVACPHLDFLFLFFKFISSLYFSHYHLVPLYPPPSASAITTLLSMFMETFSLLLNPSTP